VSGRRPDERRRVGLKTAAEELGLTVEAVRKRAQRGTLDSERDEDGRVNVWLDVDRTTDRTEPNPTPLVEALQDRIDSLEAQLSDARERDRENRRIIAALTQRIPELPPPDTPQDVPAEPPEWPESAEGKQYGMSSQEAQESLHDHRPWWQRWFGG
jgi:hypothetical protein